MKADLLLPRDTSETHMERKKMSQKTPLSSAALIQQKSEAEQRLLELRQAQADALERGDDFQHSDEISQITERLAAFDTAIAGAEKREDAAAAKAAIASTRVRAGEMANAARSIEDERLAALNDAETHALGLAEATGRYASLSEKQRLHIRDSNEFYSRQPEHLRRLGDVYRVVPGGMHVNHTRDLDEDAIFLRLGNYLGTALSRIRSRQIGNVSWDLHNITDTRSWVEQERAALHSKIEEETIRNMDFIISNIGAGEDDATE
ncbi:hypothetical protein [Rhizobium leguminosarum]|uniref:hypothetical protein n=1 Tax=Rhizobium leguminosarum TaxID=384 RepID=UPI0010322C35|nr:hypothetical protein [Rhizobium leguminosarum]TAX09319.1 hypothetical protein ELI07_07310 [Rhizobium leguminosarum]TAY11838.1 hypothetical protein ELH96_08835 [Rhizobium leguminosarum]